MIPDINLSLAGLLLDMASSAGGTPRELGYSRAARAVLLLERHVTPLIEANTFRTIPGIGPTTDRIARELIEEGASSFVEQSVADAGLEDKVAAHRRLRQHFLSRAAVNEVLARDGVPSPARYRGDIQMHSVWSDGAHTVAAMAEACIERGYKYAGITDHSYGLPIAHGMSMAAVADQHAEIDAINRSMGRRFRILKGIEANIRADGTIDMAADELRRFEFIVASPHSLLRKEDDQTRRMVGAVSQAGVAILGHPQGRRFNTRPGVSADWGRVFAAASRRQVAIEIDGSWERQDVHYALAAQALAHGCLFALDSDAHATGELWFTDVALAHARLAGIPDERIVNFWPAARLLSWAQEAWSR